MTLSAVRRTRGEQIGDILTALEHVWKMYPSKSFNEVMSELLRSSDAPRTDDEVEAVLRNHLKKLMSGSRDQT